MPKTTADDALRQMRQLAFEGWIPADDPGELTSDDEYTPPELVGMIEDFFGGEIALDTCWDPRCFVKPRVGYTKFDNPDRCSWCGRTSCDHAGGLRSNWIHDPSGKLFRSRWVQPPYSSPRLWIQRLAELHDGAEHDIVGDSLALIKCDPSTRAWEHAWKADAILFFKKRIPHVQPGRTTRFVAPFPQSMLYFGPHIDGFVGFFAELGVIRRKPAVVVDEDVPVAREHELLKIDGIPAATYPFLPTACEKHNAPDCQLCADAITVVDEPVLELDARAENPQAWPACTCGVRIGRAHASDCPLGGRENPSPPPCKGCGAHFEDDAARRVHQCLAGGSNR